MKKLIISRHKGFLDFLIQEGIIQEGREYDVLSHITNPESLSGREVVTSGIPLSLAAKCKTVTTVDLKLPPEMRGKELTAEEIRKYVIGVTTYKVITLKGGLR